MTDVETKYGKVLEETAQLEKEGTPVGKTQEVDVDAALKAIMSAISAPTSGSGAKRMVTTEKTAKPDKAAVQRTEHVEKVTTGHASHRAVLPKAAARVVPNKLKSPLETSYAGTRLAPCIEVEKPAPVKQEMATSTKRPLRGANSSGPKHPVTRPYRFDAQAGPSTVVFSLTDLQEAVNAGLEKAQKELPVGTVIRDRWMDTANNAHDLAFVVSHYQNDLRTAKNKTAGGAILVSTILPPREMVFSGDNAEPYRDYNWCPWSAPHQWLNSSAAAGQWYKPQWDGDAIPLTASTQDGFMRGISQELRKVATPIVRILPRVMTDYSVTREEFPAKFFLPTVDELGLGEDLSWAFEYFRVGVRSMQHHRRIFRTPNGTPCWYWTCSNYYNSLNYVQYVSREGHKSYTRARESRHVPVCFAIVQR